MKLPRSTSVSIFYIFILIILVSGLIWANIRFSQYQIGGEEFLITWNSGRVYLEDQINPYSQLVVSSTQDSIRKLNGVDSTRLLRFDHPFYVQLILLPFLAIEDYFFARGIWMLILEIASGVFVFIILLLVKWRPRPLAMCLLLLFGLLWAPGFQSIISGSPIVLAGALIAGALLAIRENLDELAGGLIALATFRTEAVGICVIFLLIWAVYSRRRRVIWGFLMAISILIVIATIFYPEWFLGYLRAIIANVQRMDSLNKIISVQLPGIGGRLGLFINLLSGIVLVYEWRKSFKKEFRWLLWTACLTLLITPFTGLPLLLANQTIYMLPIILFMAISTERWKEMAFWINGMGLFIVFISSWYYLLPVLLNRFSQNSLSSFFLLPTILIVGLYWIRWWAIRSPVSWDAGLSIPES